MSIGGRLKEERERLGLTQPAFAEVAGAKKRTLIDWEKDVSAPTAHQLAELAKIGADVLYIVTGSPAAGVKLPPALSGEEELMLESYRSASKDLRRAALAVLLASARHVHSEPSVRDLTMTNNAPGGVQVGISRGGTVKGGNSKLPRGTK